MSDITITSQGFRINDSTTLTFENTTGDLSLNAGKISKDGIEIISNSVSYLSLSGGVVKLGDNTVIFPNPDLANASTVTLVIPDGKSLGGLNPTAPSGVTNVVASQYVGLSAQISFTGTDTAVSYRVTSSPDNLSTTGNTSPLLLGGLTEGVLYTFSVVAIDADYNETDPVASNEIQVTAPIVTEDNSGKYVLAILHFDSEVLSSGYYRNANFGYGSYLLKSAGLSFLGGQRVYNGAIGGDNGEYVSLVTWDYDANEGRIAVTSNANIVDTDTTLIPTFTFVTDGDGNPLYVDAESIAVSGSGQYQFVLNVGDDSTYVSSDYGATWNVKDTGYTDYYQVGISGNGQVMCFLNEGNGELRISTDYGETWNSIQTGIQYYADSIQLNTDGNVIIISTYMTKYMSRDQGQTFQEFTGLPNGGSIAVNGAGDRLLYHSWDGYVYSKTSIDGGLTWTDSIVPTNGDSWYGPSVMSSSGKYATYMVRLVNQTNRMWFSNDNGSTFNTGYQVPTGSYVYNLNMAPRL